MCSQISLQTFAQWSGGAAWALELQHSSQDHALVWQTRGQGRCVVHGMRRGLSVHTALAIPAGTPFSFELGAQSYGMVCLIRAGCGLLMPDEATLLRIRDVQTQTELTSILEMMQREQNTAKPFTDEVLMGLGTLLTVWLRRAMILQGDENNPRPNAAERLVRAYAALMERDFATGKAMADYARALGVTPTHLTRTCRQCSGLTASDMLTQRVLHEARRELERAQRPIAQIAASLGFSSAAYFSRFVQHHTGLTPSGLRKQALTQLRTSGA